MGFTFSDDCDSTNMLFKGLEGENKRKLHLKFAEYDQEDIYFHETGGRSKVYQCYCETYSSLQSSVMKKQHICYPYFRIKSTQYVYYLVVSILIAIVNTLVRFFNVFLIKQIGFDLKTEEINMMVSSIFVSQFFFSGLILLFTNADFENTFLGWLRLPFKGAFSDFTTRWYLEVSPSLISIMMTKAVWPYINVCIWYGLRLLKRFFDSGCESCLKDKHGTKKKTI